MTWLWQSGKPGNLCLAGASYEPRTADLGRLKPVFYQESIMNGVSRHTAEELSESKATWAVLFLGVYTFLLLLFTNSLLYQI